MSISESRQTRLYTLVEQEIHADFYKAILEWRYPVNLLHVSASGNLAIEREDIIRLRPDILLISYQALDGKRLRELNQTRTDCPMMGVVLILASCDFASVRTLGQVIKASEAGMAVFLNESLTKSNQLWGIIRSVSEKRVIIDPSLREVMLGGNTMSALLRGLTEREIEVLDLMAKGYTNASLAKTLFIDVKTVRHHISNMYSKLAADNLLGSKNRRVSAIRLYLETTGQLVSAGTHLLPHKE